MMLMTILHSGEIYVPPVDTLAFEVQQGEPPMDVLEERLRFVRALKWLPEDHVDDSDRYDNTPETYHLTRRAEDGRVLATMRLTKIENIKESLSYEMLHGNQELQEVIAGQQSTVADGELWDLTRLSFPLDGSQQSARIDDAMVELFGMGEYISTLGAGEKGAVYWIFTTTSWMKKFFDDHGIEYQMLGQGALTNADGRPEKTLFCSVDVRSAVATLKDDPVHQLTYAALGRGMEEARRLYAAG